MTVEQRLFLMQDKQYKAFHAKLIPTIDPNRIIGVRTPQLRKFASEFAALPEADEFINTLPHKYYEENNLHAFLVERIKDYDAAIYRTNQFLPYIDNWATCDMFKPKVFKKNTDKLLDSISVWINSDKTYVVRYAIELLMNLYSGDNFNPKYAYAVSNIKSDEYYVNMMIAWYFAELLFKQYECAVKFFTDRSLDSWTHNKAIQKAVESRRISDEKKEYLRTLKIKQMVF